MPLSFFHWSLLPLIPDFLLPYYHRHPPINMSVTIAAQRDLLGEFLLLLESRNGQDKFTRLIQYAAKFGKWQAEEEKKEQWIKVRNNMCKESIENGWKNSKTLSRMFRC